MNLIVTCARHLEQETKDEINEILTKLGDHDSVISILDMPGILIVDTTSISPKEFIQEIKYRLEEEPWSIRYILKVIPIQKTTSTTLEDIVQASKDYHNFIADNETYRISVKKRNSNISSSEIITLVAKNIQKKVSLEEPDWEILIEILGPKTGISLIRSEDVLSVEKLKRQSSLSLE